MPRWPLFVMLAAALTAARAQDRDPTAPPAQAGEVAGAIHGGTGALPQGSSVIVQDGKPHLVVGTRLYAVGQKVGSAKLVRISETEIWLQEGKHIAKLPRFAGIQRKTAAAPVACAPVQAPAPSRRASARTVPPPSTNRAVTTVAPCDGAQP